MHVHAHTHKSKMWRPLSGISITCQNIPILFSAASRLGGTLDLFSALVFTGRRQFVQVFVLWLQRLMSPCYQSSSEITVSGRGKICRHGDKPVSCRRRCGDPPGRITLFSESHGDVYPLIPVSRGRGVNTISLTSCHCTRRRLVFIYSPNMTQ